MLRNVLRWLGYSQMGNGDESKLVISVVGESRSKSSSLSKALTINWLSSWLGWKKAVPLARPEARAAPAAAKARPEIAELFSNNKSSWGMPQDWQGTGTQVQPSTKAPSVNGTKAARKCRATSVGTLEQKKQRGRWDKRLVVGQTLPLLDHRSKTLYIYIYYIAL